MENKVNEKKVSLSQIEQVNVYIKGIQDKYRTEVISIDLLKRTLGGIQKMYGMLVYHHLGIIEKANVMTDSAKSFATINLKMTARAMASAEQLKFLTMTAPLTMDPEKISEHVDVSLKVMASSLDGSSKKDEVLAKIESYLRNPKLIQDVSSYRKAILKSVQIIKQVKERESLI